MGNNNCYQDRVRDFFKKAEDRFKYDTAVGTEKELPFRLVNIEETTVENEVGGPSYTVVRNFTHEDYKFDFNDWELTMPNNQNSGCLTSEKNLCNVPSEEVGGSGWETKSWAYFRKKLRTPRHCVEEFRDVPEATMYLKELATKILPRAASERLDMFFRVLEYFYATKHILSTRIEEIMAPYTSVSEVEAKVSLLDAVGDVIVPSMLTPRYLSRIHQRLTMLYGRDNGLGARNNNAVFGWQASDELNDYYHIDNPEIFDEVKYSDRVNPLIQRYGLSQVIGNKFVHIADNYAYRANIDANGKLVHVAPYRNIAKDEISGAGFETIQSQEWLDADLEWTTFVGQKPFTIGYQDAFMPVEGDDMKELGKKFDWRIFNKATCDDEDALWFHWYATARFYVKPNMSKNLVGVYLPTSPQRLDANFHPNGDCPPTITECNVLPVNCSSSIEIVACCDSPTSGHLLVTLTADITAEPYNVDLDTPAAAFIRNRDGDLLPVEVVSQSEKDNNTFVIDFTPAGLAGEPCCANGEMIEFFLPDAQDLDDTLSCISPVYDACPANAAFTLYTFYLENPLKCVANTDVVTVKFSDGTTVNATSNGVYDALARTLQLTFSPALTPHLLCNKQIISVCCVASETVDCPGCDVNEDDTPCSDLQTTPAVVTAVAFNASAYTRLEVLHLDVTFDRPVLATTPGTAAITWTGVGGNYVINLTAQVVADNTIRYTGAIPNEAGSVSLAAQTFGGTIQTVDGVDANKASTFTIAAIVVV